MKKFKSGFTLAEVLITLGIIGVVAAIVMPSVMTNYTYKTVGVKLSKFVSQLEGSTRPYVVQNTTFADKGGASDYIMESFLIKNLEEISSQKESIDCSRTPKDSRCGANNGTSVEVVKNLVEDGVPSFEAQTKNLVPNNAVIVKIKDGTEFQAYAFDTDYDEPDEINTRQVGEVIWGISFAPKVNGLPKAVQKSYQFLVTELGYVYPDRANDDCVGEIWDAEFLTTSKTFAEGGKCVDYGTDD